MVSSNDTHRAKLGRCIKWFPGAQRPSRGAALFKGRSGRSGRSDAAQAPLVAMEWIGLLLAALVFAPQTKMRHLALLLLMILLVVLLLVVSRPNIDRRPLLVMTVLTTLAMVLPPVISDEWADRRDAWRAFAGPTWFLLILYFTMLWTGLQWARGVSGGDAPRS